MPNIPDSPRSNVFSATLIVPDAARRQALAKVLAGAQVTIAGEFEVYPPAGRLADIERLNCQVAIVDLDRDVEQAIPVIEHICSHNDSITVMAYSSKNDATLMRRSMQAGAREFLIEPVLPEVLAEALARTSSRRPIQVKTKGQMLVFASSKGGVGVSTLSTNFALALTKESGARVVVVDMDFQLGEIAAGLGHTANFSIVDALMNAPRLDRDFLSTLLIRHESGMAVLGSPEKYSFFHSTVGEGADKLFRILREEFDYIVVDTGTCHGHIQEMLFGAADKIYLVTDMSFPALRNGHRLISYLSTRDGLDRMEVIVNRFNSRHTKIDENSAVKALGRPICWRIPNAYAAMRAAEDSGIPLTIANSPVMRVLSQMAKTVCGKPPANEKAAAKGFNLFGLRGLLNPGEA